MNADTLSAGTLNDRLAEAARFAVLSRLMPVLRHDVLGAMQPGRMLLMVLEKRLQSVEPDLQAIAKNVASVSLLTKQASVSCAVAMGWVGAGEDPCVSLRGFVDEAIGLLTLELSGHGLTLVNNIEDGSAQASQNFLRSVLMGALLAFCDQYFRGGTLQVSLEPAATSLDEGGQLQVRLLPGAAVVAAASQHVVPKYRLIDWADVEAMAQSSGVQMARGEGWLTLGLPG